MYIIAQKIPYHIHTENLLKKIKPNWDQISERKKRQLKANLKEESDTFEKYNIDYNPEKKLFSYLKNCEGVGFSIPLPEDKNYTIKQLEQYEKVDEMPDI